MRIANFGDLDKSKRPSRPNSHENVTSNSNGLLRCSVSD
jgi:hypothetical protein